MVGNHGPVRRSKSIFLLSVGHACVDVYQGSVAALVPFFVAERSYAYAAASALVLAASLLSSVAQPVFGAITDRWSLPWLIPVSTVVGGVGIALSGVQGVYGLTLVFVAISGLGVAAYHPEAARVARQASEGSHTAMAYFSTGGNVGFALAPLLVGVVVGTGGLSWTPVLVLPALVGATLTIPVLRALAHRRATEAPVGEIVRRDDVPAFLKLTVAVIFRSITFVGLSTFIALYAQQRLGGSAAVGTAALFVLYIGGVIGSIWGGSLANRWGRVSITRWSYAVTVVAVAGVVWVPGWAMFVFIALASIGLYVPFSLQVTLGQDYLPTRMGTASGITLGLTVSIGGIASPAIGALADATSLQTALAPLVAMPVISWLAISRLHEPASTMRSATAGSGEVETTAAAPQR